MARRRSTGGDHEGAGEGQSEGKDSVPFDSIDNAPEEKRYAELRSRLRTWSMRRRTVTTPTSIARATPDYIKNMITGAGADGRRDSGGGGNGRARCRRRVSTCLLAATGKRSLHRGVP